MRTNERPRSALSRANFWKDKFSILTWPRTDRFAGIDAVSWSIDRVNSPGFGFGALAPEGAAKTARRGSTESFFELSVKSTLGAAFQPAIVAVAEAFSPAREKLKGLTSIVSLARLMPIRLFRETGMVLPLYIRSADALRSTGLTSASSKPEMLRPRLRTSLAVPDCLS